MAPPGTERNRMTDIIVHAPDLASYLVGSFGVDVIEDEHGESLIRLPAHFLTILPEDGWAAKNSC